MLSPADAGLVRRDPALPGLSTLLDVDAFCAALRRHLPGLVEHQATLRYLRYKPGMNCVAAYRLSGAGAKTDLYAKAHGPDAPVKLDKVQMKPGVPGFLGVASLMLEECAICIYTFPNDRKLKALKRLGDPEAPRRLLRELFPERRELWRGTLRCLRYKPERRYVARLDSAEGPSAVIKCYTAPKYRLANTGTEAITSQSSLRIARKLGGSEQRNILAFEWLLGHQLSELLRDTELSPTEKAVTITRAGAALGELHKQPGEGLKERGRQNEIAILLAQTRTLNHLCPWLKKLTDSVVGRLASWISHQPMRQQSIHGDFYAEQLLWSADAIAVLDLDEAARGDGDADLGLFMAHLERDALKGIMKPTLVETLSAALLQGYRGQRPEAALTSVAPYTAVGLFCLAAEPFRYRETNWPEQVEAILVRAQALLDGKAS